MKRFGEALKKEALKKKKIPTDIYRKQQKKKEKKKQKKERVEQLEKIVSKKNPHVVKEKLDILRKKESQGKLLPEEKKKLKHYEGLWNLIKEKVKNKSYIYNNNGVVYKLNDENNNREEEEEPNVQENIHRHGISYDDSSSDIDSDPDSNSGQNLYSDSDVEAGLRSHSSVSFDPSEEDTVKNVDKEKDDFFLESLPSLPDGLPDGLVDGLEDEYADQYMGQYMGEITYADVPNSYYYPNHGTNMYYNTTQYAPFSVSSSSTHIGMHNVGLYNNANASMSNYYYNPYVVPNCDQSSFNMNYLNRKDKEENASTNDRQNGNVNNNIDSSDKPTDTSNRENTTNCVHGENSDEVKNGSREGNSSQNIEGNDVYSSHNGILGDAPCLDNTNGNPHDNVSNQSDCANKCALGNTSSPSPNSKLSDHKCTSEQEIPPQTVAGDQKTESVVNSSDQYANPYANQYTNPYVNQYANAYANQHANAYANQHANPYANQYANLYVNSYNRESIYMNNAHVMNAKSSGHHNVGNWGGYRNSGYSSYAPPYNAINSSGTAGSSNYFMPAYGSVPKCSMSNSRMKESQVNFPNFRGGSVNSYGVESRKYVHKGKRNNYSNMRNDENIFSKKFQTKGDPHYSNASSYDNIPVNSLPKYESNVNKRNVHVNTNDKKEEKGGVQYFVPINLRIKNKLTDACETKINVIEKESKDKDDNFVNIDLEYKKFIKEVHFN
ncbi:WW domain-binding protein 11, putative [Plasmodium ovale]|uniref:WW domain-binding protein 11, putative n=2 Tax=Plasmodium ovale TaxID=36330 RepID=A0A1A8W3K2_PLAOA|nr:WW domain-binding protein 11, putative [Plasmodium ovale curtisi]SBT02665.1 WW domain-binding protein 11, putative [Plasmodium ovale curtisi]SCP06148.1 WW domain-binding protein 11, putative [Plasmodium ovale]